MMEDIYGNTVLEIGDTILTQDKYIGKVKAVHSYNEYIIELLNKDNDHDLYLINVNEIQYVLSPFKFGQK